MAAKTYLKTTLTIIAILFILAHLTFAAPPRYEIIDLGTLGGDESGASFINGRGQIVGSAYNQQGNHRATLFDSIGNGNNIDLGTLGGTTSWVRSINNSGQIVGYAENEQGYGRATLFDPNGNGKNIDLGTLGELRSNALSVNNSGQIVGSARNEQEYQRATLFDPTGGGNNIDLGTLGGIHSQAWSINDRGQIVGNARIPRGYSHATLFDPTGGGNNIDLGTLGGSSSNVHSINDRGQIVGWAANISLDNRATLFDPTGGGNNIELGTLGGRLSWALSINDLGQIVGAAEDQLRDARATLFDPTGNGNNIDLNTLINPASGWILTSAYCINNHGWIVGNGINPAGQYHAFLMIPPRKIYVDDDAAGANDGSSWDNAYNYLQDALTDANSSTVPVEIFVAQGVYKPDQGAGITPGDREATFQLINGVTIKGGYAGFDEPDPNARDIKLYETILTGDLYDNDGFYFVGKEENSYHIVTGSGTDATAVLDGFNIRYGHANRQADPWGAGMYNDNGSPTVKNCVFISNHAFAEQGSMGGGMYNYRSSPALINCAFIANFADVTDKNQAGGNGGGMCNNLSSPTLTNCTFRSNGAREYGGGMYNIDSNTTLTYSTLQANRAFLYGGGMYNCRSTLTLTKCMLIGNVAYVDNGGAMYSDTSDTTLTNCTLTQNSGTNGSSLACDSPGQLHPSSVQMTNCILWDHGNEIWNNDNSSVIISYSDVRCGWIGLGNIAADPMFVNPGGVENFRLAESSPCIDTGDPNYIPEPNETDFDGKPRIVGGRIDMGVYEFQGRLILYVDNDAPGSNNGSSWADAYNFLQDALIPADPTGGPVEIRVAEGIYKPDQGAAVTPGDRAAAFRIKARVTVKGGYAGFGHSDPNTRDINIYETILSGDLNGNDGHNFKNNDENSYSVITGGARGETTILDGFTITGGNANGVKFFNKQGGGIRIYPDYGFTTANCTIIRNRAESHGGGMHSSGWGGGDSIITNCRFISNRSESRGGAICLDGESSPDIISCIFSGNSAVAGGAIYNYEAYPNIINCTFTGNRALDECGGVIDLDGISGFENCILWGNTDAGGADESAQIGWSNPMSINFSCIQGWTGALGGIGNINEDPRFVRPGFWKTEDLWIDGDYHLLLDSPCINAGDPDYIPEPNETDLDGNPRVMDGRIDMGAYEYGGAMSAEVDIEPNTLNLQSMGKWITAFLQLGEDYNVADIDPNSVVLENEIKPDRFWLTEDEQIAVAKFNRQQVQAILDIGEVELTITGRLTDGTLFEAKDIIRIIAKRGRK
jgi:probable HAF family extracellular repeat protein/predicted outer membrane repeat protein